MATYKHIRSNVDSKRPTTSLADGQIAINTNVASPGVFFKDSAGTGIVKVGPVHVGTTAPNSTPGTGGSTGNSKGEQWLDTSLAPPQLKVWDGTAFVGVVADELPVSKLQNGSAYQLLQTDAAGTGVEWASNIDIPGSLNVTSAAVFDSTVSHPLGSAAAPTIAFTGDANTGIYSPGGNQIALTTSGSTRLYINGSGNIGIGTELPDSVLHIAKTNAPKILTEDTTNNAKAFLSANNTITATGSDSNHPYVVKINSSEAARFNTDSALLIGKTNSSGDALLQVNGNVDIASTNKFKIGNIKVLDASSLGSAVVSSSLTSVGTIGTGVWNGTPIASAYIADSAVTSAKIADGAIVNADVNASAAIAGTKISPDFGSQAVTTTGVINANGKVSFPLGSAGAPSLFPGNDTDTGIFSSSADSLSFSTGGVEQVQIDPDGKLLLRVDTARTNYKNGGTSVSPVFQSEGATATAGSIGIKRNVDNANGPAIFLAKSRAGTGSITVVSPGDKLGTLSFNGADGSNLIQGANIVAHVDGTPGLSDMPTRLVFSTTPDGAAVPQEHMTIKADGKIGIGLSNPNAALDIEGGFQCSGNALINGLNVGRGGGDLSTNIALGFEAMESNTATNGVAVGYRALKNNTGTGCVAVGRDTLSDNTGAGNTAIGRQSLQSNTSGDNNVAVGRTSLTTNTTGTLNTAVGYQSLSVNTTGSYNLALGRAALKACTTGSGNIGLGNTTSGNVNSPVFQVTTEDNRIVLGHTAITNAYVQVAWTVTSDARDKMNFAPVPYGLDFVNQLKPTAYQFKIDRDTETPNGDVRYGFKAQDILALEGSNPVIIDTEDPERLKYKGEHLVPILVNAVQELTVMVNELKAELATLKSA